MSRPWPENVLECLPCEGQGVVGEDGGLGEELCLACRGTGLQDQPDGTTDDQEAARAQDDAR